MDLQLEFDDEATRLRAVCEAFERIIWEDWIDKGLTLERRATAKLSFTPLAQELLSPFESWHCYHFEFVGLVDKQTLSFQFDALIGFTEGGAFPGSRVGPIGDDGLTHAAVEAWRHWNIARRYKEGLNSSQGDNL